MIVVNNIRFVQYLDLQDKSEYDYLIKYSMTFKKAVNIFGVGDFKKMKFGLIKDLQQDMSQGLTWFKDANHEQGLMDYISILTGKSIRKLCRYRLLEIIQFRNYIVQEIEAISNIESKVLAHEATDEEIMAGIDSFNVFGVYSQLRSVANAYNQTIDWARNLPYEDAFVELCYQKTQSDYQTSLMSLRSHVE
jgi:hypothetical protein